jgi:hypothetical protein
MIEDKVEIAKRRGVDRRAADAHLRAHATRFPSLLERPRTAPHARSLQQTCPTNAAVQGPPTVDILLESKLFK